MNEWRIVDQLKLRLGRFRPTSFRRIVSHFKYQGWVVLGWDEIKFQDLPRFHLHRPGQSFPVDCLNQSQTIRARIYLRNLSY